MCGYPVERKPTLILEYRCPALYQTGELKKYTFILVTVTIISFYSVALWCYGVDQENSAQAGKKLQPLSSPSPDPPYLHAINLFKLEKGSGYLLTV